LKKNRKKKEVKEIIKEQEKNKGRKYVNTKVGFASNTKT
jgi:hypothetical protein